MYFFSNCHRFFFLFLTHFFELQVYLKKIDKRIKEYKINMLNEPRPDKKLLVLDIDYTLFDHKSAAETGTIFII